jgi:NDP-sugar pyrophosphorylase family protein
LAVCVNDVADYGSLKRRADGCIEAFLEKGATGPGLVSAGVYVFKPALLKRLADIDKGSLERDVFPDLAASAIFCHVVEGRFIDIGTPERLSGFQDMTDQ